MEDSNKRAFEEIDTTDEEGTSKELFNKKLKADAQMFLKKHVVSDAYKVLLHQIFENNLKPKFVDEWKELLAGNKQFKQGIDQSEDNLEQLTWSLYNENKSFLECYLHAKAENNTEIYQQLDQYAENTLMEEITTHVINVFDDMIDEQALPDEIDQGAEHIAAIEDDFDFASAAKILKRDGVVVIPVLNQERNIAWNNEFFSMARTWPEYFHKNKTIEQEDATRRVFGAFGAYGNPSSFHDAPVRAWRKFIHDHISVKLFAHMVQKDENIAILIDRLQQRRQFKDRVDANGKFCKDQLTSEDWHCDHSPNLAQNDQVFGGWINLDVEHHQSFHCVKGTQRTQPGKQGFVKFSDEEKLEFGKTKSEIAIPPGHMIIFDQTIVHCVSAGACPEKPSIRMYIGHWITKSNEPLFQTLFERIKKLAVPQIPSGQWPVMFSQNHFSMAPQIFQNTLSIFTENACQQRETKDGQLYYTPDHLPKGEEVYENQEKGIFSKNLRCMASLRYLEPDESLLKRFQYSEEDLGILKPHKIN